MIWRLMPGRGGRSQQDAVAVVPIGQPEVGLSGSLDDGLEVPGAQAENPAML